MRGRDSADDGICRHGGVAMKYVCPECGSEVKTAPMIYRPKFEFMCKNKKCGKLLYAFEVRIAESDTEAK